MNTDPASPLLQLDGVQIAYGGIQAVKGIDLQLHRGERVSLIGANGAGKTTTLNEARRDKCAAADAINGISRIFTRRKEFAD